MPLAIRGIPLDNYIAVGAPCLPDETGGPLAIRDVVELFPPVVVTSKTGDNGTFEGHLYVKSIFTSVVDDLVPMPGDVE
ncbi:hypothetical protein MHT86_08235 [Corynebacterium mastitidis]|uniref:Uncharacterized protein n=1 Tax=Corynebacterium mastitidis TaxID=161890 RepID=A0A2N0X520_9CORY|nr:hypothetical protein [Corynebacterium mastitidis]MCH6197482.1 hypothetical protein [Corynebacterium mastitidis]PKF67790.1 hypothetical protein CXB45_10410 [Corynebacterium mastitidis]